ncbi:neprilysin-2-like isoform X3 [Varroa destructor]|uniref:Uncharacterized protein n=2 Tax=Varroa TaxID=62624 RepID=A0A7M7IXY0_VARDE|nr:neprilysin-2-like isoform X3 [Varroa destructor]
MMRCVFSVASSRTPNAPEAYKLRNCYSRETLLPDANMSDDTTEIALTEAGDQLATITTGHTIKRRPFSRNTELLLVGVITCLGSSLLWSSIAFSLDGSQRNSPHHFVGDGSEHGQQHIAHIKESGTKICISKECVTTASSLLGAMDATADPCDDFFEYACGTWNKAHPIPDDRATITTFEVLADQVQLTIKDLLEEQESTRDNEATAKTKRMYSACMNAKAASDETLRTWLADLGGWPLLSPGSWNQPNTTLENFIASLKVNFDMAVLFVEWVGPDDMKSSVNIIQLDQMNPVLRGKDWYIAERFHKDRVAYRQLIYDVAVLLGGTELKRDELFESIDELIAFETELVKIGVPDEERHDSGMRYRKLTLRDLTELVPAFNFTAFLLEVFKGIPVNLTSSEPLVYYSHEYFSSLSPILERTNRRTIQNYALWRVINSVLPNLPESFSKPRMDFLKSTTGISSDKKDWRKCVEATSKKLDYGVGALFIRDHFDRSSKVMAQEMIHNIREAFNELLEENDWMDKETKRVARDKANSMHEKIGYPDLFDDEKLLEKEYDGLNIGPDFLRTLGNINRWDLNRTHSRLRLPVDRERWTTYPAAVNAFYGPNKNDILFPANILQPFFYSKHFPKSVNYGGIGVVIGHEITHGFDDKGRQFDKDGNLQQWWNNKTIETFRSRAKCMIAQYSQFTVPGFGNVNGRLTQGENIADNGGLKQAFRPCEICLGGRDTGCDAVSPSENIRQRVKLR